jgi:uncharacterized protein (TIGR03435 family)
MTFHLEDIMRGTTLALCVLASATVLAQRPLEFDVSSVKPAAPNRPLGDSLHRAPPGQWRLFGVTIDNALRVAYPEFRLPGLIAGGPSWISQERFDLQGRMSPATTQADVDVMVRRLLADRFALRTHVEQRMLDVYDLVVATPGRLGPGLTRASSACVTWRMTASAVPEECKLYGRAGATGGVRTSVATIDDLITIFTMPALLPPSPGLSQGPIDRPIVDKTGLQGFFQIIGPSALAAAADPASAGSFFTLLEEQLGLKLTRSRALVDVLVIDSVSKPEPD